MDGSRKRGVVFVVDGRVFVAPGAFSQRRRFSGQDAYHQIQAARESTMTMRVKVRRVSSHVCSGPRADLAQSVVRKK